MNTLIRFMQDNVGRAARVILGLALIGLGLVVIGGTLGTILAIVGLLPIVMGVWGPCLLGFFFKPSHA